MLFFNEDELQNVVGPREQRAVHCLAMRTNSLLTPWQARCGTFTLLPFKNADYQASSCVETRKPDGVYFLFIALKRLLAF